MGVQNLQAIVLAGGHGTSLSEINGNCPKCLINIGCLPLIWYPLNMLQKHNFREVIVIVLENERFDVQQALESLPLQMKVDLIAIPCDVDFGTADSLNFIRDRIKLDVLIVSCDVVTNVSLNALIEKFRLHDASAVVLLFQKSFQANASLPGLKSRNFEHDLVGICSETKRLFFLSSMSDFEKIVNLNAPMLRSNSNITIRKDLCDSHIYIIKKNVLDLVRKKNISSLKGELLALVIKNQTTLRCSKDLNLDTQESSNISQKKFFNYKSNEIDFQTLPSDSAMLTYSCDNCYAVEASKEEFGVRVNTIYNFLAVNRKISEIWPQLIFNSVSLISPKAVIKSSDVKEISVADDAKIFDKSMSKFTVFGRGCKVFSQNKISRSIIMDGAIIEKCCNIDNCIIGSKAVVREGCNLKDSTVGANFELKPYSTFCGKFVSNVDSFMEIDV